jgi:hypothetical protein
VQVTRLQQNAEERRQAIDVVRRHGKRRKVEAPFNGSMATETPTAPPAAAATGVDDSVGPVEEEDGSTDDDAPPAATHTSDGQEAEKGESPPRDGAGSAVGPESTATTERAAAPPRHERTSTALQQAAKIAILTSGSYDEVSLKESPRLLPAEVDLPPRYNTATSDALRMRCRVVADLHEKGYWVTAGVKFGGDFLVYPGDPHRYHSHFVAVIVGPDQPILPHDIVSFGRLGTVVKKALVLCTVGADDNVDYVTAVWKGNVADR